MSAVVDVGQNVIASRQMKMVAGLTRDIKREIVERLVDSVAELAEELRINLSQFISIAVEWQQF